LSNKWQISNGELPEHLPTENVWRVLTGMEASTDFEQMQKADYNYTEEALFCFTYSEYEYKQEHDLDHGANPGER
jgi:hypothetical protein